MNKQKEMEDKRANLIKEMRQELNKPSKKSKQSKKLNDNSLEQENEDLQLAVTEYEKWINNIGEPAVQQNKAYEKANKAIQEVLSCESMSVNEKIERIKVVLPRGEVKSTSHIK